MPDPASGSAFGVKYAHLVAGFAGGVVALSFLQQASLPQRVLSVFVGTASAGYAAPLIVLFYPAAVPEVEGAAAFIIGITAMNLVPLLLNLTAKLKNDAMLVLRILVRGEVGKRPDRHRRGD